MRDGDRLNVLATLIQYAAIMSLIAIVILSLVSMFFGPEQDWPNFTSFEPVTSPPWAVGAGK